MERTPSLLSLSSCGSSSASRSRNGDPLLPLNEKPPQARIPRIKAVLSHCLYRRVILWVVVTGVALLIIIVSHSPHLWVSGVVDYAKGNSTGEYAPKATGEETDGNSDKDLSNTALVESVADGSQKPTVNLEEADELDHEEDEREREQFEEEANSKPWLRFPHLDGYFPGLKSLVGISKLIPEYPNTTEQVPLPAPSNNHRMPTPSPFNPYNTNRDNIKKCYLDKEQKIAAPDVYAYSGVPQHMPDPVLGSYEIFGIRDDVCFDRFGRFGPYGLGYNISEGGSGVGTDTEDSNSKDVWAKSGKINYDSVDWNAAQERCAEVNKHRLVQTDDETGELPRSDAERVGKTSRQGVVVRCYTDFEWTTLAVVNFRALITELSLKSGGEYTVHILLHVLDDEEPIWADDSVVQRILDANIPPEFQDLVTLWSEAQMRLFYPGQIKNEISNPSGRNLLSVYRSAHLPLQVFAVQHPEYEYFWNWEMDMRHLGNYFELFDRVGRWADSQPRSLMWERSERYYIPSYHGSWDNFTKTVQHDHVQSGKAEIFGPVSFPDRTTLRFEERGESPLPRNCGNGQDPAQCGVGEGADLITFNPIFEVSGSGWVFSNDVAGYPEVTDDSPPRRSCIITAGRLSRRLLLSMHEEVWRHHRTMFSEMFPTTVALHRGLKAIYAPHPISMERAWIPVGTAVDEAFNSGSHHSTSNHNSPFYLGNEHVHKGATFYYHSEFAGLLWRRWLGYAQMDGRGRSGETDSGDLRGGYEEESSKDSSGRMCLRSMLLHPIKSEIPSA
ncbi:hypothetical protein QQS21_008985 [Conoideocrella luteorostrata]|uniref:Major facilitator superfamily transporter n=1 Tax=Conoideocrella luteorostrata TaxID=1105319 RepID=A0AAJ0CHS4_9HYPO|nr:hypothetical protein QQS21_008985 [Conoideocrella luteorostrata]